MITKKKEKENSAKNTRPTFLTSAATYFVLKHDAKFFRLDFLELKVRKKFLHDSIYTKKLCL